MIALSGASASDRHTSGSSAFPRSRAKDVGDLVGRQSVGEQALGLACVAKQVGAGGEVGHEFVDQPVERGRWDRAEPGRGERHRAQVGLVELFEQPRGRRLSHHKQQGCGFFGVR